MSLSVLTGCGSAFNGSIPGRNGNGQGPTPPSGQAQITAVNPTSVIAGSAAFTLTVTGLNFVSTTSVLWNNTILTTTYVSSTTLTAQVPAALIATPTTASIDPGPSQPLNFGVNFTITIPPLTGNNSFSMSKVTVAANDLEWDPVSQEFYLSVASINTSSPDSITALNPQTGVLGPSVSPGSEPDKLAISADGAYLYAGLNSAGSIRRYTLPALQPDIDIPLGSSSNFGPYYAIDIQPEPGSSHSVAVSRGAAPISPREIGGVLIYDDAVARPQSVAGFGSISAIIDALAWNPNQLSLYGIDSEAGTGLSLMSVSSRGVQLTAQVQGGGSGNLLHFDATTGYLYSDSGVVTDPATNTVLGTFPSSSIQGGFNGSPIMAPDGTLNIAYFLGQTSYDAAPGNYVVEAFDLKQRTFLGAIPLTGIVGTPYKMLRWGTNGLAFLTTGNGTAGYGVYLISGAFVTAPGA